MSNLSFLTFFAQFHQYSKKTEWNDVTQINHLIESLISELKRILIEMFLSNNLQDAVNLINHYYNNLMHLNFWKTHQSNTASAPVSNKDSNVMNIDTENESYASKNFFKQQKYIKKDHCFKCESKNHLFSKCFILIFKKALRITETSSFSISSQFISSEIVSLNKFSQN